LPFPVKKKIRFLEKKYLTGKRMCSIFDDMEWKNIIGEDGYQISSDGRVRKLWGHKEPTERRLSMATNGYVFIVLRGKTRLVHRLVAEHFLPVDKDRSEVNHIDFDKTNNCIDNLQWCTKVENARHRFLVRDQRKIKRLTPKRGEHREECRMLPSRNVLAELSSSMTQSDIARLYNVSRGAVNQQLAYV
jgi:hypothetical protein